MNKRIIQLAEQAGLQLGTVLENYTTPVKTITVEQKKFAELIVQECVGILETEIELVKGYKSTAHNDFDVRWHDGKITHFTKLIEKSKKHFGVEE
jgi:hypothetical protein